jgi:fibronectin type 3 domain-containing protein
MRLPVEATVAARRRLRSVAGCGLMIALMTWAVAARGSSVPDCGVWHPVWPAGSSLTGVGYGGGQFVGVGPSGVATSADGVTWTAVPINLGAGPLIRVAWNGSLWVAVGNGGLLLTSPDGAVWTPRVSPTEKNLAGVAWSGSLWVAVGQARTILTSGNGADWTPVDAGAGGDLTSVIWTGTRFVAVGQGGTVMMSDNGSAWTTSAVAGEDWLTDVISVGGQLVVVAWDGTVLTKSVFTDWTARAETGAALRRIVWTGGRYIAVGDGAAIVSSPDAVNWRSDTIQAFPVAGYLTGIAWSGRQAVVVGASVGVLASACGVWADIALAPANPQIGQTIVMSAAQAQGFVVARWEFGELGCDGAEPSRQVVCLGNPCNFDVSFAFATSGQKTVSLYAWTGQLDGEGNRIYILVGTRTLTVASTGSCSTCLAPGQATDPVPANGAVRAGGSVNLQWSPPASGTPPFTYDVELDGGTVCAAATATECQVGGVAESGSVHTWKVTARNACGQATSLPWTFLACSAPGLPVANFDAQPVGPLPAWPAQQQPFVGQEVVLRDRSTNAPDDWAWSGLTATGLLSGREARATWWSPGARTVGLRAANCLGWSDEKRSAVTVNPDVRPRVWAFDCGTPTSPLVAGFTRATAATAYSPALGYGWLSGSLTARDRGLGDDLARDFVFGTDATFVVNVPNRTYDVVLWLGDTMRAHDQMAVFLEGEQVDLVSTAAGEVVQRVFRVAVADGQLTLRFADLGGADPNFVLAGLELFAGDPVRVDFGTAGSPVAAGYQRASEATAFAPPAWCGWSAGRISSRDRSTGSDLLRDLDVTQDGTFSCGVAPGIWDVTLTMGDATARHDQMGVFLQGAQVDSVTRAAGQFATLRYRVKVADGDLALRLADLGGSDANTVVNAVEAVRVGPFDFGTATSPVAAGYVQVTNGTRYGAATGYGWLDGAVGSRDRGTGSDATRDFDMTTAATFAVDVPDGTYEVGVVMGDATTAHDRMAIFLEGVQVGVLDSAKGKFVERTFRVTVADGQLTVRLEDHGGSDANLVINALSIAPAR